MPLVFLNGTRTTEIYTLSLHDALPICELSRGADMKSSPPVSTNVNSTPFQSADRKSTRLNSSHQIISYAVFCLEKKKLHKKRQNLFQDIKSVIHLHMETKHWGLNKVNN